MAPTTTTLVGPPEIYRSHQNTTVSPPSSSTTTTSHPFIDAMISHFNSTTLSPTDPPMGYTENNSATYLSTGNPCLDFFFHIVPDTPPQTVTQRLLQSWQHDPLKTLKLVCNLRGIRGTGKSDKEGYYTSVLWLHENHPKTLACNLACMADFGYFKDLPEILYRLLEGADVRKKAKEERLKRSRHYRRYNKSKRVGRSRRRSRKEKKSVPREQRVLLEMKRVEIEKVNASKNRNEKRVMMATKAIERYSSDPDYKFLHDRVSALFAELLRSDIKFLANGESQKISLAAKWCPSLDSSFDKSTLLCESIAKKVFPREEYTEYDGVEEAHYAYRVRDRLRKQVLVPLRKALELPEVYIGQNQWHLIPYNRVASVAMKNYKEKFLKHDTQRFEEYLNNVKSGKAKIAAGALLPHEIISCLEDEDGGQVAELQWNRMVEDMLKKGKLNNCLAICDVSGSMCGTPMEVCVALGVLVSELSEDPWKGKVITFSENPKLETVQGDDLRSKIEFVKTMDWGMNTDFQKVFDLILEVASSGRLSEDEMVKRVFVFSDMEFDQASVNPWETDYQVIKRKFIEKGYGGAMPEMVFWNLRDSVATPVAGKENGVALVSGFSKNLMTLFMEDGGQLNPESVMDSAISGEEYKKLVVVD
ncbi:putative von Willebrand factor A-like domain superfamily [Helianthus annuus]|nr:putative von Willebrand factor A-like domain superfamily [Helianthus annuus]